MHNSTTMLAKGHATLTFYTIIDKDMDWLITHHKIVTLMFEVINEYFTEMF